MAILLSPGGPDVFPSATADPELVVGTVNGVVFAKRAGREWSVTHRALQGKHVSALLREPGGTFFAGTHDQSLWASADGGHSWEERGHGLASSNIYALGSCATGRGVRLLVGTEPARLYESDDLGARWTELPGLIAAATTSRWTFPAPPHDAHVKNISVDPHRPDTVYVAVEQGGLYRSTDGGRTFRELSGFDDDVHRTVVPPLEPEHLYITTGIGAYHSPDAGETWEQITTRQDRIGYPDALLAHPGRRRALFTAGARTGPGQWRTTHDADARIARSDDGGRSWTMLSGGLPEHIRGNVEAMAMNAWPSGFTLFAGTTDGDVYASDDEGETWRTIVTGIAPVSKTGHYIPLQPEPELAAAR